MQVVPVMDAGFTFVFAGAGDRSMRLTKLREMVGGMNLFRGRAVAVATRKEKRIVNFILNFGTS